MQNLKYHLQRGGLFHFDIKCNSNGLKEFIAFQKYLGLYTRIPFQFISDQVNFEDKQSINEYIFREITDDISRLQIDKTLEIRNSSHISELLLKSEEHHKNIQELTPIDAKLYCLVKALLSDQKNMILLELDKAQFSLEMQERVLRVLKREIEQKNRSIFIMGEFPPLWAEQKTLSIQIDQRRKYFIQENQISEPSENSNNWQKDCESPHNRSA